MPNGRARLESWKEIAGYVGRTVRTVQRWEAQEGLPVHRQLHQTSGNVYAYSDELDEWIAARQISPEKQGGAEAANGNYVNGAGPAASPAITPRSPRPWLFPAAAITIIALIVGGWLGSRLLRPREPVWLLVTALDNRTGEPLLDESVQFLLEREISNSSAVFVMPRGRVEDTLRLMRRDLNSRVDETLAREICQRDGEVRLIASTRAERIGSAWLLTVGVSDVSGRSLGGASEQVRSIEDVPAAVTRLGSVIRQRAGDVAPPRRGEGMDPVTTRSMRAAQLFSRANIEEERFNIELAERLERAALAEDPDCAVAHIFLSWNLKEQGKYPESRQHLDRAVELAPTATERERMFILLSQAVMNEDWKASVEIGSRMVASFPDDYWARANLFQALNEIRQFSAAREQAWLTSNLRPNSYFFACRALAPAIRFGDLDMADRLVKRLVRLEPIVRMEVCARNIQAFPVHQAWVAGNLLEAKTWADKVAGAPRQKNLDPTAVSFYFSLGRLSDAARLMEREKAIPTSERLIWSYLRDDPAAMRTAAEALTAPFIEPAPLLFIQPGWTREYAELRLRDACGAKLQDSYSASSRMEALQGHVESANDFRSKYVEHVDVPGGHNGWHIVHLSLAHSYELRGDVHAALVTLETADKGQAALFDSAFSGVAFQQRLRYDQARLLRKVGRPRDAERIEAALRRELQFADADHPIVTRLNKPDRQPFQVY